VLAALSLVCLLLRIVLQLLLLSLRSEEFTELERPKRLSWVVQQLMEVEVSELGRGRAWRAGARGAADAPHARSASARAGLALTRGSEPTLTYPGLTRWKMRRDLRRTMSAFCSAEGQQAVIATVREVQADFEAAVRALEIDRRRRSK
jgi:hypothetical protein